jgi:hypothetical protein
MSIGSLQSEYGRFRITVDVCWNIQIGVTYLQMRASRLIVVRLNGTIDFIDMNCPTDSIDSSV